MKTLAIIGAGQLGIQTAHYAISDKKYDKVVFFDDFATDNLISGYELLGNTNQIITQFGLKNFDELIIGIGYNNLGKRKELYEFFKDKIPFGKVIHSSCWIDTTVQIHDGCILYPNSTFDYMSIICENTVITNDCMIAHNTVVGRHSYISARLALAGFAKIGEQCFIGINSTIIDNIKITNEVRIGAGTVVIKSIDKSGLYVGNPAKFIR